MTEIDELLREGQRAWNLGNPKDAMNFYDRVLVLEPKNTEALLKKGHVLGKIGRYKQAILYYDMVLEKEHNLLAVLNKGLACHYIEKYDEAITCYNIVLDEKPDNPTALYNKASSLIRSNKIKEGIEILARVTDIDFSFRAKAKFDVDFEGIRKLNEFKEIIIGENRKQYT